MESDVAKVNLAIWQPPGRAGTGTGTSQDGITAGQNRTVVYQATRLNEEDNTYGGRRT